MDWGRQWLKHRIVRRIGVNQDLSEAAHRCRPGRAAEDCRLAKPGAGRQGHFFNPAVQFSTTVIGGDDAPADTALIRKRFPSLLTAY